MNATHGSIGQHYPVVHYLYQPYVQGVEFSFLGSRAIPLKKIWFKNSLAAGSTGATTYVHPSR
jgi:hypothetical protein